MVVMVSQWLLSDAKLQGHAQGLVIAAHARASMLCSDRSLTLLVEPGWLTRVRRSGSWPTVRLARQRFGKDDLCTPQSFIIGQNLYT